MQQDSMNVRFAEEKVPKLILQLAAPAIAAQLVNALYNVVDRIYIGRMEGVGTLALTGVGLTFPIIMLISAFAALVGFGGAPLASIRMGEGRKDKAEQLLGNCFAALVGLSLVLTLVLSFSQESLLRLFGASDQTLPYASSYMRIYLIGTISVQISLGMNQFISAQGFAKTSMGTVLMGAVINIVLDPILIFGLDMGVEGAALATIIAQTASALWVMRFLIAGKGELHLRLPCMRIDPKVLLAAVGLGVSPFIMQATESLVQIAFNTSLAKYGGDAYVGVMVIMSSVMQFMTLPIQGLTQGAQPIIGYNYGARNFARVKTTIKYSTAFCFLTGLTLWILTVFFPRLPASLFTTDEAMIELAAKTMPLFFFGMILFGFQLSFQQTFVALGQAKVSVFIASLRKIILLIPLVFILPQFVLPQTTAVFLAEPISDSLSALTCCALFAYKYKKLLCQPEPPINPPEVLP